MWSWRTARRLGFLLVPDAAAFDAFYRRLIEVIPPKNVTSRFVLENVKSETALPITN